MPRTVQRQIAFRWRPTASSRPFLRTITFMSEQPVEASGSNPGETPPAAVSAPSKRVRRTMLSTGFSDVPGRTCEVCGFQGFRWQSECPDGHPLT